MAYDLTRISLEEARLKANEIVARCSKVLGVFFELVDEERKSFISHISGKKYDWINFYYRASKINFDKFIDAFLSIKPNEGFGVLIKRANIGLKTELIIRVHHFRQTGEIKTEVVLYKVI